MVLAQGEHIGTVVCGIECLLSNDTPSQFLQMTAEKGALTSKDAAHYSLTLHCSVSEILCPLQYVYSSMDDPYTNLCRNSSSCAMWPEFRGEKLQKLYFGKFYFKNAETFMLHVTFSTYDTWFGLDAKFKPQLKSKQGLRNFKIFVLELAI